MKKTENTEEIQPTSQVLEEVDLSDDMSEEESSSVGNAAVNLLELESQINRYVDDIEKTKLTLKSQREMYNAAFENDAVYSEHAEKEKEIKKLKAAAKQNIVKQPGVVVVNQKMNELKAEIKDAEDMLSGLLEQYHTKAGTTQITNDDGEIREIIRQYKLVKKRI